MTLGETARLIVNLVLKDEASGAIKTIQGNVASLDKTVTTTKTRFTDFSRGIVQGFGQAFGQATIGLLKDAGRAVTDFVGGSIEAYKQQEVATARLTASLNANVTGWQGQKDAIDGAMKAGINLGFQDDEVAASLSRIVAATHDVGKALDVLSVAQDLARFKGISLEDASNALVKVEGGRYRLLGELGIQVKDFSTAEEALAAVEKVAAGQADSYTNTLAGRTDILNAKLNEEQELIGAKLVPAQLAWNQAMLDSITLIDKIATGFAPEKQTIEDTKQTFLGSMPTRDEVLARLEALRKIPASLQNGKNLLFDLDVDGVKTTWQHQIDDLNYYLKNSAFDASGKAITSAWDEQTGELATDKSLFTAIGIQIAAANAAAEAAREPGIHLVQAFSDGVDGGLASMPKVPWTEVLDYADTIKAAHDLGTGVVSAITKGLWDDRSDLEQTANDLRDILKNGLTPEQLAMEAAGKDYIRLVMKGMNSEKTGAVETAQELAGAAIKAMVDAADNGVLGGKSARATGRYLAGLANSGMDSKHLEAFLSGQGLSKEQIRGLKDKYPQFFNAGSGAADQVRDGVNSFNWYHFGSTKGAQFLNGFGSAIQQLLRIISQPGPTNGGTGPGDPRYVPPPSSGGGGGGGTRLRALGGTVAAGQAYIVGERRPELFIPKTNGYILPSLPPQASPMAWQHSQAGLNGNINVTVILSAREVTQELKREYDLTNRRTR